MSRPRDYKRIRLQYLSVQMELNVFQFAFCEMISCGFNLALTENYRELMAVQNKDSTVLIHKVKYLSVVMAPGLCSGDCT